MLIPETEFALTRNFYNQSFSGYASVSAISQINDTIWMLLKSLFVCFSLLKAGAVMQIHADAAIPENLERVPDFFSGLNARQAELILLSYCYHF